jgi:hypothetical protein
VTWFGYDWMQSLTHAHWISTSGALRKSLWRSSCSSYPDLILIISFYPDRIPCIRDCWFRYDWRQSLSPWPEGSNKHVKLPVCTQHCCSLFWTCSAAELANALQRYGCTGL